MGWGCLKHEMDETSQAWAEACSVMHEHSKKMEGESETPCPRCFMELEHDLHQLELELKESVCPTHERSRCGCYE